MSVCGICTIISCIVLLLLDSNNYYDIINNAKCLSKILCVV